MGLIDILKTRVRATKLEGLQVRAARRDIRKQSRAASLVTERSESIKIAKKKGTARARGQMGFGGFVKGIQKSLPPSISKGKMRPRRLEDIYKQPKIPKFF